jgi:hypothetical protein
MSVNDDENQTYLLKVFAKSSFQELCILVKQSEKEIV